MIIALDYDDTYTNDPMMWNSIIKIFHDWGHTVYCVTSRNPTLYEGITPILDQLKPIIGADKIIATSWEQKRQFCHKLGILPDIWIDDKPEAIVDLNFKPVDHASILQELKNNAAIN